MRTLEMVDAEQRPIAEAATGFDLDEAGLAAARTTAVALFQPMGSPDAAPTVVQVPGRQGNPTVELRIHGGRRAGLHPAIFLIHGGGFVMGSAAMRDGLDHALAKASGAVVVAVDYRLAPETPFPGPLDDCYAGLHWLFDRATTIGVDPTRIVILGESGGGGLAAALTLLVRDRGEMAPAGQMLIYPMLDHRTGSRAERHPNPTTGEFAWTRQDNQFGWNAMRGGQSLNDDMLGYFSPAVARHLDGLPPAFIAVGALDLFFDEDIDYARRLSHAGIPVELHVYPGAIHGFDLFDSTRLAQRFKADQLGALADWFARAN